MRTSSLIFMLLVLAACPGGGGDDDDDGDGVGSGPLTPAQAEPYCRAQCERTFACDPITPVADCIASCQADLSGWVRGDAVAAISACVAALPCGAGDDGCAGEVQPQAVHRAYETRCREVMVMCLDPMEVDSICEVDGNPTVDDSIGFVRFITPAIVLEMMACFDQGCAAALTCLQGVLESHGIDV